MNVCVFGIVLVVALLDNVAAPGPLPHEPLLGPHHGSKMCLACHGITDPAKCTLIQSCPERFCVSDVYLKDGVMSHTFSCHAECTQMHISLDSLIGKRERGPHDSGFHLCRACCDDIACEKSHCDIDDLQAHVATTPKPTTTTKRPTTTTAKPTTRAPTTTTTTTALPTTTTDVRICQDLESETFRCSDLDKYNFCVDSTSIVNVIAHERCPLHCGFCRPDGTLPPLTSFIPATAEQTTHVPDTTTMAPTSTMAPTTTTTIPTTTTKAITTPTPCMDNEQQQFNCEEWKSFGFCDATSGVGHTIALERCQKTCGICDA